MIRFASICLLLIGGLLTGCQPAEPPQFQFNQVEWLKQQRLHLGEDEQFAPALKSELEQVLTRTWGTPDQPKFPWQSTASELLPSQQLQMAAGAVLSDQDGRPQGLYREHCAQCHGVDGNGAGPTSALLEPYPRDFRMGRFKFKSTNMRQPPTDDDLKSVLVQGIPGTAMPSFRRLPEQELDALVAYVKYLSLRGQYERYLFHQLAVTADDSLFADADDRRTRLDDRSDTAALLQHIDRLADDSFEERFLTRWQSPTIATVPSVPPFLRRSDGADFATARQAGQALFSGAAGCYQCHGEDGRGRGEWVSYDDWTNDWLKTPGVDEHHAESWEPFLDAGAHRPRRSSPRNLQQGVFRGGAEPSQLYLRISQGIEGSAMPAHPALSPEQVWQLVAFVQSISSGSATPARQ